MLTVPPCWAGIFRCPTQAGQLGIFMFQDGPAVGVAAPGDRAAGHFPQAVGQLRKARRDDEVVIIPPGVGSYKAPACFCRLWLKSAWPWIAHPECENGPAGRQDMVRVGAQIP